MPISRTFFHSRLFIPLVHLLRCLPFLMSFFSGLQPPIFYALFVQLSSLVLCPLHINLIPTTLLSIFASATVPLFYYLSWWSVFKAPLRLTNMVIHCSFKPALTCTLAHCKRESEQNKLTMYSVHCRVFTQLIVALWCHATLYWPSHRTINLAQLTIIQYDYYWLRHSIYHPVPQSGSMSQCDSLRPGTKEALKNILFAMQSTMATIPAMTASTPVTPTSSQKQPSMAVQPEQVCKHE